LPFRFKRFLLTSSSFQKKKKKNNNEKKNHREEKNAQKGGNLPLFKQKKKKKHKERREFTSCQTEGKKKKKTQREKDHRKEKKYVEKVIFSPFYIWDEAFLLFFPLQIPSTLTSTPSSSLVSTSPRNSMLLKLMSSSKLWRWNEQEMR
jgi:hypothetical protein